MANYTQDSQITNIEDVKKFFRHIVYDLGINFHPDDDFNDYVTLENEEKCMNDEQANLYNHLMDEAFGVCGDKVYEISCDILKERLQTI